MVEQPLERLEQRRGGGEDFVALVERVAGKEIVHPPAGLGDDDEPGGDVPEIDMALEIAVEAAQPYRRGRARRSRNDGIRSRR